jgi:hypothetical protein
LNADGFYSVGVFLLTWKYGQELWEQLACDSGLSVTDALSDTPHSRASPLPHWTFSVSEHTAIDRPAQRHQPLHQFLRIQRFRLVHCSFPRKKQLSCDPKTIAVTGQTRESGGYLFG